MNSKIHITVEERLLLHLLEYSKFEDAYDVPISLSQEGIAMAINIRRNDVSRTIKNIMNKGWIDVRLGHVEGVGRRRKVYFLTPIGFTNATKIRDAIMELIIPITEKEGKSSLKIKDLNDFFNVKKSIIDVVNIVNKYGKFDPTFEFKEAVIESDEERQLIQFLENAPKLEGFIGRQKEVAELVNAVKDGKIILLKGIAGIGKSFMAFKVCESLLDTHNLLWIKVREFDSLETIFESLSTFLQQADLNEFAEYMNRNKDYDLNDIQDHLVSDLKNIGPLLIVFDDIQKASPTIVPFFSILVDIKDSLPQVTYLFTARYPPKFFDRRQVVVERKILEMEIQGLDREASKEILKNVTVTQRRFDEIYKVTRGHPLALQLIQKSKNIDSFKEISNYVNEEIFSGLDENEVTMLSALSVYREGVSAPVLFVEDKLDYNTIDSLLQKLLIYENTEGYYEMHDLLRESIYARLTPKQRKQYHALASKYYATQKMANAHLEEVYHLLKAEEYEDSAKKIVEYSKVLIENKLSIELLYLIRDVKSSIKPDLLKKYILKLNDILGEIYDLWGGWDSIIEYNLQNFMLIRLIKMPKDSSKINEEILQELYPHLYNYYSKTKSVKEIKDKVQLEDVKTLVNIHNSFVDIKRTEEEWAQAVKDHQESYEFLLSIEDFEGALNMLFELGWIYWRRSQFEQAIDTYNKALELCVKLDKEKQRDVRNKINMDLGHLYWISGNHIKSLHYYQQALIYYNKMGSKDEAIKINNYIGNIYFLLNKLDLAQEQYRIAKDMATETWYLNAMTYTQLHMLQVKVLEKLQYQVTKDELAQYREELKEIKETFEKINDYSGAKYATLWSMLLE